MPLKTFNGHSIFNIHSSKCESVTYGESVRKTNKNI
jgi:hypothetical protein